MTQRLDRFYDIESNGALTSTRLPAPCRRGKVRDVYELGDELLIVSTDRISAFDFVLPSGIPDKGKLLTSMSRFWFDQLDVANHLIGFDIPASLSRQVPCQPLEGRVMRVRQADVIPFECVVRGYLEGSGWREYQDNGQVCGIRLPSGLEQCARLPEPIFTPATKADRGHDENVTFERMADELGDDTAGRLRDLSLRIYDRAQQIASSRGILIADTKFEFGWIDGRIHLIDEVLTPDSSRFWSKSSYRPGASQPSFDKQFVREWLAASQWDRSGPPPPLPGEIISRTREKYADACRRICGEDFLG